MTNSNLLIDKVNQILESEGLEPSDIIYHKDCGAIEIKFTDKKRKKEVIEECHW